jgi:hypothetical protein
LQLRNEPLALGCRLVPRQQMASQIPRTKDQRRHSS